MRQLFALAAAATLSTGCLASKGDIRLLQDELTAARTQHAQQLQQQGQAQAQAAAQANALLLARMDSLIRVLDHANDSIRVLNVRVAAFQAVANSNFFNLGQQMDVVMERVGMTQQAFKEFKANQQEQAEMRAATTPDSSGRTPAGPGPDQMYRTAHDQLLQGNYGVARAAFTDLLERYPNNLETAPAAMLGLGQALQAEANITAADSVYQRVVTVYPKAPEAANALYKHALILIDQRKFPDARVALQRVVREYPRSDEAGFAAARLQNLPQ